MDQDLRRGVFLHVAVVVTTSLIAFALAGYAVVALVAWVGFPETFQLLTRPKLVDHLEEIPTAFWWSTIVCLTLIAIPIGFATHWFLPREGKSHVWIVATLLFLMNFQQFLGQQAAFKWVSLVMMILIPAGFLVGAKLRRKPFIESTDQVGGQ
jgi:hypothetical protein